MLGRLVAWLRIFDYDTLSALELGIEHDEDVRLVRIAVEQGRVLLSRDHLLIERAQKAGADALLMTPDHVKDQLCELMGHFSIDVEPVMARCTVCNHPLRKASTGDLTSISESVPAHLLEEKKEFWKCDQCGKTYWQGSHWRNIKKMTCELRDLSDGHSACRFTGR